MKKYLYKGQIVTANSKEEAKTKVVAKISFPYKVTLNESTSKNKLRLVEKLALKIKNEFESGYTYYRFKTRKDANQFKEILKDNKIEFTEEDLSKNSIPKEDIAILKANGFKKSSDYEEETYSHKNYLGIKGLFADISYHEKEFSVSVFFDNDYDEYLPRTLKYFEFDGNRKSKKFKSVKDCLDYLKQYSKAVNKAIELSNNFLANLKKVEEEVKKFF